MRAKMCLYVHCANSILYTFYIVSKRKQNDQFSLKGLKNFTSVKNMFASDLIKCVKMFISFKIGIQSRHTKALLRLKTLLF